jgi:hypothetical protein
MFLSGFLFNPVFSLLSIFIFKMTDIGYIPDITDFISEMHQITIEEIKYDCRPGMTQMSITVNSGAADVHPDKWRIQWFELLFAP